MNFLGSRHGMHRAAFHIEIMHQLWRGITGYAMGKALDNQMIRPIL